MKNGFDWDTVERLAIGRLGVTKGAFAVWRTRNSVPHRYRLPLVIHSAGAITADDFDRLDAEGPRDQAAE